MDRLRGRRCPAQRRDADLTFANAVDLFRTIALRKCKEIIDWCNPREFIGERRLASIHCRTSK